MTRSLLMLTVILSLLASICFFFYNGEIDSSEETLCTTESIPASGIDGSRDAEKGECKEVKSEQNTYPEVSYPTPNTDPEKRNRVEGVILHHTAEPTVESSLRVLTVSKRHVGTHCVIDTDGTRYIMCEPEVVTFHAGLSVLNGKVGCNDFTIGIEFQGNTLEEPLTQDQINSAIEYLKPIIAKYHIPIGNIVTHEMVRNAYKKRFPNKRCSGKVDITPAEYQRFMRELKKSLNYEK